VKQQLAKAEKKLWQSTACATPCWPLLFKVQPLTM